MLLGHRRVIWVSPAGSWRLFTPTLPECWWQIVSRFIQVEREEKQHTALRGRCTMQRKKGKGGEVCECVWGGYLSNQYLSNQENTKKAVTWCPHVIFTTGELWGVYQRRMTSVLTGFLPICKTFKMEATWVPVFHISIDQEEKNTKEASG